MSLFVSLIAAVVVLLAAYLLGSFPFAIIVSRAMRLPDPRQFGSKNPGATNVLRSGSKLAAALTLLGDAAKGWVAVYLAAWLVHQWQWPDLIVALAAVAVFLGHVFPVFTRFKGGKGVATALGILLAIQPWLALAAAVTWLLVARISRYSSLAAILAAVFAPLYYLLGADSFWPFSPMLCTALIVIAVMLCFRHQANIVRLLTGKEPRIGQKNKRV